mgnify:FL=1
MPFVLAVEVSLAAIDQYEAVKMVSSFDDFSATLVHLTPQVDYDFLDELRRGEVRQLIVIEEEAEGVYCLTKDKLDELLL